MYCFSRNCDHIRAFVTLHVCNACARMCSSCESVNNDVVVVVVLVVGTLILFVDTAREPTPLLRRRGDFVVEVEDAMTFRLFFDFSFSLSSSIVDARTTWSSSLMRFLFSRFLKRGGEKPFSGGWSSTLQPVEVGSRGEVSRIGRGGSIGTRFPDVPGMASDMYASFPRALPPLGTTLLLISRSSSFSLYKNDEN